MKDDLRRQLETLERSVADFEKAARQALGFVRTIEYRGIPFNVSKRFVIANLSPLAFFHLVEHIDEDVGKAILDLYDRLDPLLSCKHHWTPLRRAEDERIRAIIGNNRLPSGGPPYICMNCTAYALGGSLPLVGRTFQ